MTNPVLILVFFSTICKTKFNILAYHDFFSTLDLHICISSAKLYEKKNILPKEMWDGNFNLIYNEF